MLGKGRKLLFKVLYHLNHIAFEILIKASSFVKKREREHVATIELLYKDFLFLHFTCLVCKTDMYIKIKFYNYLINI